MQGQTKRYALIGAVLGLFAIIIFGAPGNSRSNAEMQQASNTAVSSVGQNKPTVSYWHVWTDKNGVSHQNRCELNAFMLESISEGAAPSWIERLSTPGSNVVVLYLPVGW